jgi:uncharacterized protein YbjT (DUF2867 family)
MAFPPGGEERRMIAVMGASGNVGGKVADLLLQQGQDVRVFGRSAERLEPLGARGAEVLRGDAMSFEHLQQLFRGTVSAVVVLPDNVADPRYVANRSTMSRAITEALRDEQVQHVVMASSVGAHRDEGVGPVVGLHELEGLLFGLANADVLSLRAAMHMEQNLLGAIPMIKEQHLNGGVIKGDLRFPLIATSDIAERAAGHLTKGDFTGHTVETILGPGDVTMNDVTLALGAALGVPDVAYVEFPPEGVKAALQGAGMSEEFASLLVEMQLAVNDGTMLEQSPRTPEATTATTVDTFLNTLMERA